MSCESNNSENAVSPIICPNEGGCIREGGENRGTNSDSDSRPRGSDPSSSSSSTSKSKEAQEEARKGENENEESEIVIPESSRIPNTPSLEEYTKHQITHYPFQARCPICIKNAAQNNPHKKVQHMRQTESFSIDYMYMTAKPTKEEVAHPILVIKARISEGVWALW